MLGFGAHFVLTILLTPAIFGIYFLVLSFISILNYCSDIGLAASLIQKKEIDDDDVKTTFTIQQILIVTLLTIGFSLTSFIQASYKLPQEGIYLYWALLFSFFLSSLKTIPSIFLERKVQFQKIVVVQILENTIFYVTVVILAKLGFGLNSFTIAVLVRSIGGLITIYSISPWIPKLGINKNHLKELLSFGAPLQLSSILALVKDDLINLYLGYVLTPTQLGYIAWAKKYSEATLRIIMDNVNRILFPVFSRLQDEPKRITRLVEKTLHFQTMLLAPAMLGFALIMAHIVFLIPKYQVKWAPAVPLFYLLSISAFLSSYSTPFTNLFYALGKVKTSLAFMIYWTTMTWVLTPFLTKMYGSYGFPLTQIFLSLTFIAVVYKAKQIAEFKFIPSIAPFVVSAGLMGIVVYSVLYFLPVTWYAVGTSIIAGAIVYPFVLHTAFKIHILNDIKNFLKS